jgi:hypothetical protein
MKRESRPELRDAMILFPGSVHVKENRKILLCKRSGDDSQISEI